MTDLEKFDIITERIKEKGEDRVTFNRHEYNIWSELYYLQYREVNGKRTLFLEKETEVIEDEFIDYWSVFYNSDDFDFEDFSEAATPFLDLYEDLIE